MTSSNDMDALAARFEEHRGHLRAVGYRMLGSVGEAEDAVQEAWLRLDRTGAEGIDNLGGWLTTVTARICLSVLRSRGTRREEPLDVYVPDPVVTGPAGNPEEQALLADTVGWALLVVLDTLAPAERIAFVLHDMFGVPFDEIGPVLGRTSNAVRQLASRARRRVRESAAEPDRDRARQREAVDAFVAASRDGDFGALVAVLDPDVVLRADTGLAATSRLVRGGANVAGQALLFSSTATVEPRRVRINGAEGFLTVVDGVLVSVMAFTVRDGRIRHITILADPGRLSAVSLPEE